MSDRRTGEEEFQFGGSASGFDLLGFWAWSTSDLLSNATRGVLAEYIVGQALGAISGDDVRVEWDAYDLRTPSGVRVEVKSSAFVQCWAQKALSRPVFSIRSARGWDAETGTTAADPTRSADVYVFALLVHEDQATIDPMDLGQWEFYVVGKEQLAARYGVQRTLSLGPLRSFADPVSFNGLRAAVAGAAVRPEE
ncbi:MAG: hypothetical protein RJQ04_22265 [Longimicrobiales bacterium]